MKNENEICKPQLVICLRNGIEIYVDEEIGRELMEDRVAGRIKGDIIIAGRCLNSVDISGIVFPRDIEDNVRRKSGMWKCKHGTWHSKADKCDCIDKEQKDKILRQAEAIAKCGKCVNGYITLEDKSMTMCECIIGL